MSELDAKGKEQCMYVKGALYYAKKHSNFVYKRNGQGERTVWALGAGCYASMTYSYEDRGYKYISVFLSKQDTTSEDAKLLTNWLVKFSSIW